MGPAEMGQGQKYESGERCGGDTQGSGEEATRMGENEAGLERT